MTIVPKKKSDSRSTSKSSVAVPKSKHQEQECQDERQQDQDHHHCRSPHRVQCPDPGDNVVEEDVDYSGYNSGDEHTHDRQPAPYTQWTEQDFQERENQFEKKINKKGWVIRKMAEDGACLFRAVADQIYGDQDMHSVLRKLCIDYIVSIQLLSLYRSELFLNAVKSKRDQSLLVPNFQYLLALLQSCRLKTLTISPTMLLRTSENI
jgi:hypothetical protein